MQAAKDYFKVIQKHDKDYDENERRETDPDSSYDIGPRVTIYNQLKLVGKQPFSNSPNRPKPHSKRYILKSAKKNPKLLN